VKHLLIKCDIIRRYEIGIDTTMNKCRVKIIKNLVLLCNGSLLYNLQWDISILVKSGFNYISFYSMKVTRFIRLIRTKQ
jgi:hypothetical protein